jgi:hypothetical protein
VLSWSSCKVSTMLTSHTHTKLVKSSSSYSPGKICPVLEVSVGWRCGKIHLWNWNWLRPGHTQT